MLFVRAIYTLQENYSDFDAMALPGQCRVLGLVFRILGALQNYLKSCGGTSGKLFPQSGSGSLLRETCGVNLVSIPSGVSALLLL